MVRRHRGQVLLAIALVAVGLVWIGQGVGVIRGSSFMVDDVRWALAGVALVAVGGAIVAFALVRSRRHP